jgi:predicted transposase YdaD
MLPCIERRCASTLKSCRRLAEDLARLARRNYKVSVPSKQPHDSLFLEVLGQPEHASGALRTVMPAVVAEALDWPTLAPCAGNFVDEALRKSYTDVLFSVAWRGGGEALVYVLYEHQSTSDRWMGLRLLRYLVRIWERWLADHRKAERIPVIVPVVLYHGAKPWSAPVAFDALLDIPEAARSAVAPCLLQFNYLVDDLSQVPDDRLRARRMTDVAKLAFACFKHARRPGDFLEILSGWGPVVIAVVRNPHARQALMRVIHYILMVNRRVEPDELQAFLDRVAGPEAKDVVMTAGERLIQQGEQRGEQRGIQKGIQQGERAALLRLLKKRFGSQVDADIERRVEAAASEEIATWLDRVLSAATLAEVLGH